MINSIFIKKAGEIEEFALTGRWYLDTCLVTGIKIMVLEYYEPTWSNKSKTGWTTEYSILEINDCRQ